MATPDTHAAKHAEKEGPEVSTPIQIAAEIKDLAPYYKARGEQAGHTDQQWIAAMAEFYATLDPKYRPVLLAVFKELAKPDQK